MVSKRCILVVTAVLAIPLCRPQTVAAQVSPQGNTAHGMFGARTLGQSFVPRPSTFGGGIQTGPSGSFLYAGRTNGANAFAAPWRQSDAAGSEQPILAAQPTLQPAVSTQPAAPVNNLPAAQTIPESAVPAPLETNGSDGASPTEQAVGMTPGAAPSAAWNFTAAGAGSHTTSPSAVRRQTYTRSPQLSDRLTQIARAKGMLTGPSIDVYLGNHVALLQGAVRTTDDGTLLTNVLALEPDVQQIDNRLVTPGTGPQPSSRQGQ